MKLATLENDEGFVNLFERLLKHKAREIVVFDPDINPAKSETDLYFYFPCDNEKHIGCGFFVWVVAVSTAEVLYLDIETVREENDLTPADMLAMTADENFKAFNVVLNQPDFKSADIPQITARWLAEWVAESVGIPVRVADHFEYQRAFAVYEEYHLKPEVMDMFFFEMRGMLTSTFFVDGKMVDRDEYDDYIDGIINRRFQGDEDDDDTG